MERYPMTEAGIMELEKELRYLREVKQVELNQKIKAARGFCDFSEDVSFRDMLDSHAELEGRIKMLENTLKHAVLIESVQVSPTIGLGSEVSIIELPDGDVETYVIVGEVEADVNAQRISNESPLGRSLLGQKVDNEVSVSTPGGSIHIRIIDVK